MFWTIKGGNNLYAGVRFVPRSKYPDSLFLFCSSGLLLEISKLRKGDNESLAVKSHCPIWQNLNVVNCTWLIWHTCMHKTHTHKNTSILVTYSFSSLMDPCFSIISSRRAATCFWWASRSWSIWTSRATRILFACSFSSAFSLLDTAWTCSEHTYSESIHWCQTYLLFPTQQNSFHQKRYTQQAKDTWFWLSRF